MDLPDAQYGEGKAFREIQAGAPMAGAGAAGVTGSAQAVPTFVGLGAPSQQPDTPVTSGASMGAGPGPEALGIIGANNADADELRKYMPILIDIAQRDDTLPGTKRWIRSIIANMNM